MWLLPRVARVAFFSQVRFVGWLAEARVRRTRHMRLARQNWQVSPGYFPCLRMLAGAGQAYLEGHWAEDSQRRVGVPCLPLLSVLRLLCYTCSKGIYGGCF